MTGKQKSLIVGKLLGDGSLENRGNANSRFQVRHAISQKDYVNWIFEQLKDLTVSNPKQNHDSYYFRTKNLPEFTNLRNDWYKNGVKVLPKGLKLTRFILNKLRVRSKDSDKFFRLVKPYIIPSMQYKIGLAP